MARTGVRWLNRSLLTGQFLGLCLSERAFRRELKKSKIELPWPEWISPGADATTHTFSYGGKRPFSIVCVQPSYAGVSRDTVRALLVHEAVHVWQKAQQASDLDGDETEAYAIQHISSVLWAAYDKARGG